MKWMVVMSPQVVLRVSALRLKTASPVRTTVATVNYHDD